MAIIVSDTFDRANDPTGLGTTDTGQSWSLLAGTSPSFTINSNVALWSWNFGDSSNALVVVPTGFTDGITKVTLVDPTNPSGGIFAIGEGIFFRCIDINYLWKLVYYRFPGPDNRLRLQRTYAGTTATTIEVSITLADEDTISCAYCGDDFEIFVNDVSQGTYDASVAPQNYGQGSGLVTSSGSYFAALTRRFDDFLVTTNGTCTPTYNCDTGACVDPEDGSGTFATLAACLADCEVPVSYDCVESSCVDPGDGTGEFFSLAACVESGCGATSQNVATQRFDAGAGSSYYVVPPIVDSGDELRGKCLKPARVTSKRTNQSIQVYGYDVDSEISVSDLEDGQNSTTGILTLDDNNNVSQSPLIGVNVPNAAMHTIRVAGDDIGEATRNRIDEIVYQLAQQGVRR